MMKKDAGNYSNGQEDGTHLFLPLEVDRSLIQPSQAVVTLDDPPRDFSSIRAYWLGFGMFLILAAFWVLDTLKEPTFGALVDGNLDHHLPLAKLVSVGTTLLLVCCIEYLSNNHEQEEKQRPVSGNQGEWSSMELATASKSTPEYDRWAYDTDSRDDPLSSRIFLFICVPYCIFFAMLASLLQFNPLVALTSPSKDAAATTTYWNAVGYSLFAAIESFGSISVATFWSFCNSNLSLHDAERFYGIIIALAQLGAVLGSTLVTVQVWSTITLIVLACLIILLHVIVMRMYSRRFPSTSENQEDSTAASMDETSFWNGIHLILRHNYVILILGASCLYEVSLTCLDYQMKLLGYARFEESERTMSFKQFMGHYGQMVNLSSLLISSIVFPWFVRRFGLKITLRLFPTLLLAVNFLAFGALPGNLAVLFFSLALLKAVTYSMHDPAKEILYIPTSNAIKFKSKFWIDVVGDRVAKAVGSSINKMAGSVDRSIQVASAPSLLTAALLWWVCYRVGSHFERLTATGCVVGGENEEDFVRSQTLRVEAYNDGDEEQEQRS